ncbi:MAG: transcription antitermination factor NusB [Paracoccus sp. (in: a-proteobacteria)]|uniref:RsmB/NOP family class I SAM-dependent RNA methyltransferase n=1 Tax=Paracoccus sp. TaxID=267 RepID=UPI0026E0083E|nr:transcription antitermination factor NusB [Paracoccus sp. (in: a-proteobacteria)]MDO5621703.1 transcription antitermination factor NusB [Paracoccus sp. (in: a-proteobacteria)]
MLLRGVRDGASLADQADMLDSLPPADRARAQRLALTTLRHQGRADTLLAPHLHRAPRPDIRDILRLATVEMLELHEAPHGVVNAAVASARALGQKGQAASGMVNAVLRKLADAGEAWAALPPQRLPDWLRKPLLAAWGADAVAAIEAAHQAGAPLDLTAKTSFPPALAAMGETLPTGSLRLALTQVSTLPGFAEGDWWVQDAAAALAVRLLDPQPGEVIADLCAAPGGKTLQLAAAGAKVTALDLSADRLERLRQNLDRCGLTAEIITGDALDWHPDSPPDAILLDAPCSATGTIRRHPDLPLIRDGGALPAITALQTRLLDHAIARLPEGGRLVYATCSLLPDEGEDQITAALARHPDLTAEIPEAAWIEPGWRSAHGLRLRPDFWPERGGMDGFYLARLRKGGGRP